MNEAAIHGMYRRSERGSEKKQHYEIQPAETSHRANQDHGIFLEDTLHVSKNFNCAGTGQHYRESLSPQFAVAGNCGLGINGCEQNVDLML
jgi:hypothetical protein